MADVKIRGGSFAAGSVCSFRADHFHFGEGLLKPAIETIHIGDSVRARVLDAKTGGPAKSSAGSVLGGAGVGALAGAWFGPPGAAIGGVVGAIAGYSNRSPGKASEATFEMEFADGRVLVGTVTAEGWAEILDAWRISQLAAASRGAVIAPPRREPPALGQSRPPAEDVVDGEVAPAKASGWVRQITDRITRK